jgi:dipeptidyl aminopeptidase/acylaminoacyl peptidase
MIVRTALVALLGSALLILPAAATGAEAPANDQSAGAPDIAIVWSGESRPSALVRNPFVRPTWIGSSDSFWYRRDADKGHDYRIVDAATGQSRPAFDRAALAAELSRLSVKAAADDLELDKLRFSDDGHSIAFEVKGQPFECTVATPHCTQQPRTDTDLEVSPDGKRGIFVRDANLWVRDIATGAERQLTTDGRQDDGYGIYPGGWKAVFVARANSKEPLPPWLVQWSPDSSKVLVPHLDQRHVATYPFIEYAPDDSYRPRVYNVHLPLVGEKPADVTWHVLDLATGAKVRLALPYDKMLPLQQDMVAIRRAFWSADGSRLWAVVFGKGLETSYLVEADTRTGAVRTIVEESGEPHANLNSTSYNPPNVQIVNDGADVIWYSERSGWGHLYLYDGRTGALKRQLTHGNWLVRDIIKIDGPRHQVYFTGSGREPGDPYYRYLYKVNFDGTGLTLLTPERLDHLLTGEDNDVLSLDGAMGYKVVSPSGRYFVYNASALDKVPEASIRRTGDGGLVATFQKGDASRLFAAGYQPPVPIALNAAAGSEPIYGVLYKPANLDPAKHNPVVDTQYDSPLTAVVPHNFMTALLIPGPLQPSTLAKYGFAAVVIDSRGTTYRSRAFSDAMFGKLDTMNLDDHVTAIRQMAEKYPWLDTDRVAISGASYGGWSALRGMLTQPDFFKAGLAAVLPGTFHEMYLDYHWYAFQGAPRYKDGALLRTSPLEIPENWTPLDSIAQVDRLKGKLLMIVGALDENAPVGSAMRFFNTAAVAGKDVSLIYMPAANHYTTMTPYTSRKALEFFQQSLGGAN